MAVSSARRIDVPTVMPGGTALTGADYVSAFRLPADGARSRTPEQWAREVFEGAPGLLRRFLLLGWSGVLGLRLGPRPSPVHVLGWPVADSGPHAIVLEAHSPLLTARNVAVVHDTDVVWVTFVRFKRRTARAVWSLAAPLHHRVVPRLMTRAGR